MYTGKLELENDRLGHVVFEPILRDTVEDVINSLLTLLDHVIPEDAFDTKEVLDAFEQLKQLPLAKTVHTTWKFGVGSRRLHITLYKIGD